MIITYQIHQLTDYINWIYFFHAWGFQPKFASVAEVHSCDHCHAGWVESFSEELQPKAAEAERLYRDAQDMLRILDGRYHAYGTFKLCEAFADGDNLILDGVTLPMLRQQTVKRAGDPCLCLTDFVRPLSAGVPDTVGAFATTVDAELEQIHEDDPYHRMLVQVLAERLAEAAAERIHEEVRKKYWGYAPDEKLTMKQLLNEDYQGIRPAVGYPSIPDQSIGFLLNQVLHMDEIGIKLTENGAMDPKASVCGLMFAHPQSHYFAVGKIGEDQLEDYAQRRGKSVDELRKFLSANLTD